MRWTLLVGALAIALATVGTTPSVSGKGHVPLHKLQVCHPGDDPVGETLTIGAAALGAHLGHGDCQLPACDFNNIFRTGDPCDPVDDGGGRCVVPNPRDDAGGVTPGCPAGTF